MPIDVAGEFIVDTGYIVAFEDTLQYRVTVLPGLRSRGKLKSFFFGGEGLVCQFSGQGRVWVQTPGYHVPFMGQRIPSFKVIDPRSLPDSTHDVKHLSADLPRTFVIGCFSFAFIRNLVSYRSA